MAGVLGYLLGNFLVGVKRFVLSLWCR
jgi:hypothetical protein